MQLDLTVITNGMKQFSAAPKQETAFTLLEIETFFTSIPMEGMFSDYFCIFEIVFIIIDNGKLSCHENKTVIWIKMKLEKWKVVYSLVT